MPTPSNLHGKAPRGRQHVFQKPRHQQSNSAQLKARVEAAGAELAAIKKAAAEDAQVASLVDLADSVLASHGHADMAKADTRVATAHVARSLHTAARVASLQAELAQLQKDYDKAPRAPRGVLRALPSGGKV